MNGINIVAGIESYTVYRYNQLWHFAICMEVIIIIKNQIGEGFSSCRFLWSDILWSFSWQQIVFVLFFSFYSLERFSDCSQNTEFDSPRCGKDSSCILNVCICVCVHNVDWHVIWIISFSVYSLVMPLMMLSIEIPFVVFFFFKLISKVMTNCSDNCNAPTVNILYTHLGLFTTVTLPIQFSAYFLNLKVKIVCLYSLHSSVASVCIFWQFECSFVQLVSAASHFSFPTLRMPCHVKCRQRCPFSKQFIIMHLLQVI